MKGLMHYSLIGVRFGMRGGPPEGQSTTGDRRNTQEGADGLLQRTDSQMHATNWTPQKLEVGVLVCLREER